MHWRNGYHHLNTMPETLKWVLQDETGRAHHTFPVHPLWPIYYSFLSKQQEPACIQRKCVHHKGPSNSSIMNVPIRIAAKWFHSPSTSDGKAPGLSILQSHWPMLMSYQTIWLAMCCFQQNFDKTNSFQEFHLVTLLFHPKKVPWRKVCFFFCFFFFFLIYIYKILLNDKVKKYSYSIKTLHLLMYWTITSEPCDGLL